MKTALVLGARAGSGNIGDAIVKAGETGEYGEWAVEGEECRRWAFDPPPAGSSIYDADALVVKLGLTYKDHFAEITDETVRDVIEANLTRPLLAARRFVETAEAVREGYTDFLADSIKHIVLIGSYAHRHPFTNGTLYCAAKAGLDMAGKTLGWELTDRGYRVHVVHPFHVQGTPMWAEVEKGVMESKGLSYEEADAYNRKDLKMPDLLTPEEVAEVVWTLLTVPAMGWLSGTSVELNGGSR